MPLLIRPGGLITAPLATIVHRPIAIAVLDCFAAAALGSALDEVDDEDGLDRVKSPRSCASAMMTVLPARVMLGVPLMAARRETLLPESYETMISLRIDAMFESKSAGTRSY